MKRIPVYAAACIFLMTVVWAGHGIYSRRIVSDHSRAIVTVPKTEYSRSFPA